MQGSSTTTLDIRGYDGLVPNRYRSVVSDTLFVTLPGTGYTNRMPLMYYVNRLAMGRRWDCLQVNYDYSSLPESTSQAMLLERLLVDVRAALVAGVGQGQYQRILLAGKSLGTLAMQMVLDDGFIDASAFIWLTPIINRAEVLECIVRNASLPSVVVFGDKDAGIADVDLAPIAQSGVCMIIMPGGDHSMMVEDGVPESIAELARVMNELDVWLDRNVTITGDTE